MDTLAQPLPLIYHYTTGKVLEKILQDGRLIVSEWEKKNNVTPPALWLSTNPIWEPTSTKMLMTNGEAKRLTKNELHTSFGLYRFVLPFVKKKLCTWKKYKHKFNTPANVYAGMERVGIEQGANPDEWFTIFKSVPLKDCLRCEVWDGEMWQLHIDFTDS